MIKPIIIKCLPPAMLVFIAGYLDNIRTTAISNERNATIAYLQSLGAHLVAESIAEGRHLK